MTEIALRSVNSIGRFLVVNWQQVVITVSLVVGGVVLGLHGKETLAATLIGAAAGFLTQPLTHNRRGP